MHLTCLKCNIPKRFIVVGMVFINSMNLYYLRTNVGMAVVSMTSSKLDSNDSKPEFEWNSKEKGMVIGSLNYGRLLCPLGGIVAGMLGGGKLVTITIILTALITLVTPFLLNINFYLFIFANACVGIFEAFGFSAFFQLWSRWAPPNERSKFISFSVIGLYFGSIMSYLLSSYILKRYTWPILYYVSGAIGFVWFWIWFMVVSDDPEKDKSITEAERKFIAGEINSAPSKKLIYPWSKIYTCPSFVVGCLGKFALACGDTFVLGHLPQFIKDTNNLEIDKIGYFSTIPMIFAFISMPVFGCLLDLIRQKKLTSLTKLHRRFGAAGLVLGGSVIVLLSSWTNLTGSIICISAYQFFTSMFIIDAQTLILDLAPRYAAFLNGNMGFFYTLGSISTPTFVGFVVTDHSRFQWNICFVTFGVFYFLAAFCYFSYVSGDLQSWADYKSDDTESKPSEEFH